MFQLIWNICVEVGRNERKEYGGEEKRREK